MTELYKLFTTRGVRNASSSGHVEIYESRKEFEDALMIALLETERNSGDYRTRMFQLVRNWFVGTGKDRETPRTLTVQKAQKLVDGEWQDLKYTLHPPRLEFYE